MKPLPLILSVSFVAVVAACGPAPESTSVTEDVEIVEPNAPAAPAAPAEPASLWSYDQQNDEMRGTTTKFADLRSDTDVRQTWPYETEPALLTLRHRSTDGLNVIIRINGQFTCRSFNGDRVAVKFDDGPIENFRCGEPDDGSPGVLFINDANRFVTKLKTSEKVIVELPIYNSGNQQITWTVTGLEWDT